jgi:hypothetical protein
MDDFPYESLLSTKKAAAVWKEENMHLSSREVYRQIDEDMDEYILQTMEVDNG